jgi:4-amino-4-deoxy-L-arabinose transferase-like glycosyltransferase
MVKINKDEHSYKILNILFLFTILVYLVALFIPILRNDDSLLYANISKNMILAKSWFLLYHPLGVDWLDKPHFPFWLIRLWFSLFGISSFNYIFIGMLFNFIGVFYTYKLAKIIYHNNYIAKLAALILLTSFHPFFSSTIDIRAEVYLIGTIIPSCYYLYKLIYLAKFTFKNLFLSAVFASCAIMTKGVFTLITIYSILIPFILTNKMSLKILITIFSHIFLIIIFLIPELIALYVQFQHKIYGIKWFLWDSQFGRFFNKGAIIRPNIGFDHYFFYFHTYFWSILPWTLWFLMYLKTVIKHINQITKEDKILLSGFLVTFILFSISKFQLDYYINVIVPFSSILIAKYINDYKGSKFINYIMLFILFIVAIILSCIILYIAIIHKLFMVGLLIILLDLIAIILLFALRNIKNVSIVIYPIIFINWLLLMIFVFYDLIYKRYEAGYHIANYINQDNTVNLVIDYQVSNLALEFYVNKDYKNIKDYKDLLHEKPPYFLVTNKNAMDLYKDKGYTFKVYDNVTMDKLIIYLLQVNKSIDLNKKLFVIKVEK